MCIAITASSYNICSTMFKFSKNVSKGSSNASSKSMQLLVNYQLKEKGQYMTADELLQTQVVDPNENNNEGGFTGLQKTDIIQFGTKGFDHWGMYIGVDCVAHLTEGIIRQDKLVDVASGRLCRINNKIKSATRRELEARKPEDILKIIYKQVNKPCEQSALQFNSEHQVTQWKYGVPFSDTVDQVLKDTGRFAGAIIGGTGGVILTGPGGLAAGVVGYEIGEKAAEGVVYALAKDH